MKGFARKCSKLRIVSKYPKKLNRSIHKLNITKYAPKSSLMLFLGASIYTLSLHRTIWSEGNINEPVQVELDGQLIKIGFFENTMKDVHGKVTFFF